MVLYIYKMKFRLGKCMIAGDVLSEEPCSHVQQGWAQLRFLGQYYHFTL